MSIWDIFKKKQETAAFMPINNQYVQPVSDRVCSTDELLEGPEQAEILRRNLTTRHYSAA
jgi:hypothetical protein